MRTILIALAFSSMAPLHAQVSPPVSVDLVPWATGIPYITDMANCGDGRLFAVQQGGSIRIITDSMTVLPTPFLNIYWLVYFVGEQGLIGMTFDPDYATNGHFYVNYTQPFAAGHNTIVSRFTVSDDDPNVADPTSEVVLMTIPQPGNMHKGGDLEFGPDGYLYLSFGDGGPQGDLPNNAQGLDNRLGKILRIDVQEDGTWSAPPTNPFADATGDTLPEIYAYGMRNPFRIALDPLNGDLWFGDVGASNYDEVDHIGVDTCGINFGWRCYEGDQPYNSTICPPDSTMTFAVVTHANILNGGSFCALIGGKVYRGTQFPRLYGRYLYTDYCSGEIRSTRPADGGGWIDESLHPTDQNGNTCIAEDANGELYLANQMNQTVFKLVDHCPMPAPVLTADGGTLTCSEAQSYAWFVDGYHITGVTGPVLEAPGNGTYWVVADMGDNCIFTTDSVLVITTGIPEEGSIALSVYPDPAVDRITVQLPSPPSGNCTIELVDLSGRPVRQWHAQAAEHFELYVGDVPAGRYLLRVSTATGFHCAALGVMR